MIENDDSYDDWQSGSGVKTKRGMAPFVQSVSAQHADLDLIMMMMIMMMMMMMMMIMMIMMMMMMIMMIMMKRDIFWDRS